MSVLRGEELDPGSEAPNPLLPLGSQRTGPQLFPLQDLGAPAALLPRPRRPLILLLPASQPVFPLRLGGKAGFRGEGLGSDTEPSLLHPPPTTLRSALPPSPPPPSTRRPRGRKKGAEEAEVSTGRPAIGAQSRLWAQEFCTASTQAPKLQTMTGTSRLGPAGRSAPWGTW